MFVKEVIEKYIQLINTEKFVRYEKDFAHRIRTGLANAYKQGLNEPKMVSLIEGIINSVQDFSTSVNRFIISTKSIYIHGVKSRVEFECYGKQECRELGDLIFVLSIVYKGKKCFEKLTISQFKKEREVKEEKSSNRNLPRFDIDMEQLYLLSRFPSFRGAKGSLIPNTDYYLPNYSGCLGSYNLLFNPGDFIFLSAKWLEILLASRKSISLKDLANLNLYEIYHCLPYPILCDPDYIEDLLYILIKLTYHCWSCKYGPLPIPFLPPCNIGVLGVSFYASNIHDFVDKYLRGCIGELIYSKVGFYNNYARMFLKDLFLRIKTKAKREGKQDIVNFVDSFFRYPYAHNFNGKDDGGNVESDFEGGGFGIIHTVINLGEG